MGGGQVRSVRHFVQFVGFPRSGHSLIGSLLDAHPQATISHELDTMGLIHKGVPFAVIAGLIRANAAAFSADGRWWNGFSYRVPAAGTARGAPLTVIGDKKGDWAARWCGKDPSLLDRLARSGAPSPRWLLVVRHPLDNIATMSLRRGGTYDRLRIASASGAAFRTALDAAKAQGKVARAASDEMIEDYRALCTAIAEMKRAIDPAAWHQLTYETFIRDPEPGLTALLEFLELPAEPEFLRACTGILHESPNRSRDSVTWTDAQLESVDAICREFDFLNGYADAL